MAEEEAEEQEAEARPAPPVRQPSLLKYLPVVLVVLLLQAGGAYYVIDEYLLQTDDLGMVIAEDETGRQRTIAPEGSEPEASVDLGEVLANPRADGARLLVRAEVTLGVWPDDVADEIKEDLNKDRVRDSVIFELGYATARELGSPEGREVVKDRMMKRINDYLYEGQVVQIYFGEFLLQAMSGDRE